MGCTGSALRCCPVGAERQLKAQQQRGSASQELSALKTQNANACLLPEHGEKAARPEEWAESARFLRGQEEEEEEQDGGRAGTASISQDIEIQVEKRKERELKEQLDALRREHTETLQELQGAHEQEKLLLTESHHRSEAALQEKIQALNSQLKSFQDRMKRVEESLLRTDYKKHIQEHGSPSPFWEQELESLHFVIEMKNEHIHGLDKKLLHLEIVEERNLQLEEKVKTLQQENEDLQVRTQNHLVMASSPRSSRRPAGLWRRRRSCWTRLAGRRRSCCTECCTPGTAPPSPWPPARCPSSPRSTGGTGDCGAALRARGCSHRGCSHRGCSHQCPQSGQGSGLAEPSGRLTDRSDGAFHSSDGAFHGSDGAFHSSDGAFHGTFTPAFPQPMWGCRGTLASHPRSPCTPCSGEGVSGGERGQPGHTDLHWARSDPALGSEYKQHQCCPRA
ncbi:coiled-coil domain-containing protein 69 isoform X1 [Zonotrichia leucophrys gambelii]|uniref:coiled-coil domain-containing protein 69 isoform X1 n=1 Tax=Zonotrichia leucophrys gambelii TaxID=257770 RepID=UPI003140898D